MANKIIKCKTCDVDMASTAKACPSCGAKNKKPVFKQWWFWVLLIVIVGAIGSSSEPESTSASNTPAPTTSSTTEKTPEPKKEKFEIVGDITDESDQFAIYLSGVIKNNSGKDCSYVQVTFNLYDKDGNQIGTALDNINNLEKDGTWKFKAMGMGESGEVASYKLAEVSGF